ncbi:SigE family RNA polymerase sigma factor [Micromonospora sp. NPDC049282]|uniref:SigE family RNA polymerase sigma factor n=1 Tax=Micromonospora sp. NPDC049282 TaxID=3364269 RepID=UPI0037224CA9
MRLETEGGGGRERQVAFTRFFHDHGKHLARLAYLLIGDRSDAEDIAQDTLIEIYRRWGEVRADTAVAYARVAVVNRSRSLQRRRAVARRFAPRLAQRDDTGPADLPDRWLWDMVQSLPRRQREVVVLRYWCDLGEADIARVLGISAGTVKSSGHRAHTRLAAALAGHDQGMDRAREGAQ